MDNQPASKDISVDKTAKRGKRKNNLDVAHSGVAKSTSSDLVGANFVTVAETVSFVVHLNFEVDLRLAPPNLLVAIVLCIFFSSVLSNGNSVSYYYQANSTSDKFITVSVGNGSS
ncbi:p12 [Rose yellow leaf virus]|nr:p12 [Rose yellow leaf virus]